MHRRRLLAVVGASATGGCLGWLPSVGGPSRSDAIADVQFSIREPRAFDSRDRPRIEFRPEAKGVLVTGQLEVGSSTCKEAKLESVEYDEDERTLSVAVTDGKSEDHPDNELFGSGLCTGDMSTDAYELVVTFSGAFPEIVRATEPGASAEKSTTARSSE